LAVKQLTDFNQHMAH